MKVITTKGELLKALEEFSNDDKVVIEVFDTVLDEDLYTFYVDPIHMGLDKDNKDRGFEIRLSAIPHEKFNSIIDEDDVVVYGNRYELSYADSDTENVELFIKGDRRGFIKVWKDSDMDDREYLCINHTIVYLDTLKKI